MGSLRMRKSAGYSRGHSLPSALSPDADQNNRIGGLCRAKKILFNNADGEPGDVIIPSVSRGANYTLAISTGGSSPAVSRFIREHFESEFPALDAMIALQSELREKLKKTEPSQPKRNAILHEVLHDDAVWLALEKDPWLLKNRSSGDTFMDEQVAGPHRDRRDQPSHGKCHGPRSLPVSR